MLIGRRGYEPGSISCGISASMYSPERKQISPRFEIFCYRLKSYPPQGEPFGPENVSGIWKIWWLEKHAVKTRYRLGQVIRKGFRTRTLRKKETKSFWVLRSNSPSRAS